METLIITREMQIKTTMRYYLKTVRIAIMKKKKREITNAGKDMDEREPLYTVDKNVDW